MVARQECSEEEESEDEKSEESDDDYEDDVPKPAMAVISAQMGAVVPPPEPAPVASGGNIFDHMEQAE